MACLTKAPGGPALGSRLAECDLLVIAVCDSEQAPPWALRDRNIR
jgi:hypothetical protein